MTRLIALGLIAAFAAAGASSSRAQDNFYAGKTINIYIGTGEGPGVMTSYPRALSQVIGKYIPGHPNFLIRHMPGGGGIKAANFIYRIAPQDGTAWGFITRGFVRAPLMGTPQAEFDPTRFGWIGTPSQETTVAAVWTAGTKVRTMRDAMNEEVVFGGTSLATDTGLFPLILNKLIGTRFKVVVGYKSSTEVDLAMERGEAQGKIWTLGVAQERQHGQLAWRGQSAPAGAVRSCAGKGPSRRAARSRSREDRGRPPSDGIDLRADCARLSVVHGP
jgi:tripartite-type tricarboxylate transporter receptor subunit TctC